MGNIKLLIIIWTLFKIEFLLIFPIIYIKKKRKKYNYLVDYTDYEFKQCGGITGFVGKIGSYKSCLMNAKKSADTRNNIRELQKRLDEYVVKYPYLNFYEINNKLEVLFETNRSYQVCYNELFNGLNGFSYDYVNLSSFKDDMYHYIEYYYILNFRDVFCLTNYSSINRETFEKCKFLDIKGLELRNVKETGIYSGGKGLSINIDENSLERGNVKSNDRDVKESGDKDIRQLLRNMYEGLTQMNVAKQEKRDEVAVNRRLYTSTIRCCGLAEDGKIYHFPKIQKFIDFKIKFYRLIFRLRRIYIIFPARKEKRLKEDYLKVNFFRKKENLLNAKKQFFNSLGLLVVNTLYSELSIDDKEIIEEKQFIVKLRDCYGTYDTYMYSSVGELLNKYSKTSLEEMISLDFLNSKEKAKRLSSFLDDKKENKKKEEIEVVRW